MRAPPAGRMASRSRACRIWRNGSTGSAAGRCRVCRASCRRRAPGSGRIRGNVRPYQPRGGGGSGRGGREGGPCPADLHILDRQPKRPVRGARAERGRRAAADHAYGRSKLAAEVALRASGVRAHDPSAGAGVWPECAGQHGYAGAARRVAMAAAVPRLGRTTLAACGRQSDERDTIRDAVPGDRERDLPRRRSGCVHLPEIIAVLRAAIDRAPRLFHSRGGGSPTCFE